MSDSSSKDKAGAISKDQTNVQQPTSVSEGFPFLSLPPIIRSRFYSLALDTITTIEPLQTIPPLLQASKEIRSEVLPLLALHSKARIQAFLYRDFKLKPSSQIKRYRLAPACKVKELLRFWNVIIPVFNTESECRLVATLDLQKKSIQVQFPGNDFVLFTSNWCDYLHDAFEEGFQKAVDWLVERPGFDGLAVKDVPSLLEKVELPGPKNFFWSHEFYGYEKEYDWYKDEDEDGDEYEDEDGDEYEDEDGDEYDAEQEEEDVLPDILEDTLLLREGFHII